MDQVTVLVPTFRRHASLGRLLTRLAEQDLEHVDWDLLVVDNDVEGSAAPVVSAFAGRMSNLDVRYVCEPTSGAAAARNRGLAEAGGDVVVMLDDDVEPAASWLRHLLAPLRESRADVAGGRVVLDPDVPRPRWLDEKVVTGYLTDFDLGPTARPLADDEFLVTASLAVRRDLALEVGGFAAGLGPQGGRQIVSDDVQFVRALRAGGGRAWWVPESVVVHELPDSRLRPSWILQRAYLQGRSDWLVDADELAERRLGGARVATAWLGDQLGRRFREGVHRPDVAFHAACDIARTGGRLVEAARLRRARSSSPLG